MALTAQASFLGIIVLRTDWEKEVTIVSSNKLCPAISDFFIIYIFVKSLLVYSLLVFVHGRRPIRLQAGCMSR